MVKIAFIALFIFIGDLAATLFLVLIGDLSPVTAILGT
ncbi:MAG: hypothetical protein RL417_372 [Pseudomonadota bacterium]|jgi:hypothetical protein